MRVLADRLTDTLSHTQTQIGFIICPMLYAIAVGQIQIENTSNGPNSLQFCGIIKTNVELKSKHVFNKAATFYVHLAKLL